MQSSYRVIKSRNTLDSGSKDINVQPVKIVNEIVTPQNEDRREEIEAIEKIAASIIENAKHESKELMNNTISKCKELEYEAKENGFKQGHEEGYNIGYDEGYEKGYGEGVTKGEEIINNANSILYQSKIKYDEFLSEKELNIRNIIIDAVETMLKREVKDMDGLNELVFSILLEEKNTKAFIIRCNSINAEGIEKNIEDFKNKLCFRGEVFVIVDSLLPEGTIIVEKDYGETSFSIENSIEKLKEILMEG